MPEAPPAPPPEPPKRSLFSFFRKKPADETAVAPEEAPKPAESGQPPQKIGLRMPFFGKASPKAEAPAKTPPPEAPPT
ncbi:hypothetical protein V5799_013024 [Amblyomma americanum]|uniref:Uncharacterized protein n=1 Tax=Amblyomma americanum TaxID=6943 RepID=A0AAQ4E762_AMBAM